MGPGSVPGPNTILVHRSTGPVATAQTLTSCGNTGQAVVTMLSRPPLIAAALLITLVTILAGAAFSGSPEAIEAQTYDKDYVDLAVSIHMPSTQLPGVAAGATYIDVTVTNFGDRTAYGVEVDINVIRPTSGPDRETYAALSDLRLPFLYGYGQSFAQAATNSSRGTWSIPEFPGGASYQITLDPLLEANLVGYEAVIRSTGSYEDEHRMANNRDEDWIEEFRRSSSDVSSFDARRAQPDYGLAVSLNDSSIIVEVSHFASGNFADACVDIILPEGVSVSGAPAYAPTDKGMVYRPSVGCRENSPGDAAGSFLVGESRPTVVSYTLTLPVSMAREGTCAAAKLTAFPPTGPGRYRDDPSDNEARSCLAPERRLLRSEDVNIWTIFPCVGVTEPPCVSGGAAQVRAVEKDNSPEAVLPSGAAVIHIPDEPNRTYDGHANSVNPGTEVSWQIPAAWDGSGLDPDHADWANLKDGFTASGVGRAAPPGRVNIRAFEGETYEVIYRMNPGTGYTGEDTVGYDPVGGNGPFDYLAEFEELGTYRIEFAVKLTHATQSGDCDTDGDGSNDAFCATESYVFHVGPAADLEIRDGGPSPHASPAQRAFTVVASNNGPDPTEGAEVELSLPEGVALLRAVPSAGWYDQNRNTWVLPRLGAYHSEETLTVVTDAARELEATATIRNTEPYRVQIGGVAHRGTVYDYLEYNSKARIRARPGIRGTAPETRPGMVLALPLGGGANAVFWTESETGENHPQLGRRRSWDIDRGSAGSWLRLHYSYNQFNGLRYYVDRTGDEGSTYRVRARYTSRVGDWTEQGEGAEGTSDSGREPGVTIRPLALALREGGRAGYNVSLDARPASNVVIDLSNSNPDVRLSTSRLEFTPSDWSRARTVTVTIAQDNDTVDENDAISHVIDQAATSADYDYFVLPEVTVTVDDNDAAVRFIAGRSGATEIGVDEGGSATYQLALGTRPAEDVRVSLSYPSGEITVEPQSLVFTPDGYNQPQTVTVYGVEDDDAVDDQSYITHHFSGGYAEDAWLNVLVTDDDRAGVGGEVELALSRGYCPGQWPTDLSGSRIEVTGYSETDGGCFYTLRLNALPTGNVTVWVQASDSSKVDLDTTISQFPGEMTPGRLTFTPENWREPQEIGFWPVRDDDAAENNDFTITHRVSGGGYGGVRIPDIQVMVVEEDRDRIGFRVEGPPGGPLAVEGDRSTSDEDLYWAAFYMFPETQPTSTVTVAMSSDNPDVTPSPSRLSFTPSNWDQGHFEGSPGKRVIVRAAQDSDAEDETATITFTVTSSDADYHGMELVPVPVRVEDDDKPVPLEGLTVSPVAGETTSLYTSWNPVTGADYYRVRWKTGAGSYGEVSVAATAGFGIDGLTADTSYTVEVQAMDTRADPHVTLAVGEATGRTLAAMGAVVVEAVAGSSDSLDVFWPAVSGATGYVVEWKTGGGSYTAVTRSDSTAISERLTGLEAGTDYSVRVTARHTIGGTTVGGDSAEGSGTTNPAAASASPAEAPPAVSFVIYHDPDAGDDAVDRYNQAVQLLTSGRIQHSQVIGDVQAEVDRLAGVTDSVLPRFFLGDPTASDWASEPGENNGGLRWLREKVAELSEG